MTCLMYVSKVKGKYIINIICKEWKQVIFEIQITINITKLIKLLDIKRFHSKIYMYTGCMTYLRKEDYSWKR